MIDATRPLALADLAHAFAVGRRHPEPSAFLHVGVGFAGFRRIRVEFDNLVPATDGVEAYLRWFFGGVIDQSGSFYGNLPIGGLTSGTTVDGVLQANAVLLSRHPVGNVATEGLSGVVSFVNAAAVSPRTCPWARPPPRSR